MSHKTNKKSLELWVAVIGLIATIITSTVFVLQEIKPVVLAMSPKPLEGVWSVESHYEKFHGEVGDWRGAGKAIIIWKRDEEHYEVYFGVNVFSEAQGTVLSAYTQGLIRANKEGWPSDIFEIGDFEYITRMHWQGKTQSFGPSGGFRYLNCRLSRTGDKVDSIDLCEFKTQKSEASVRFRWQSYLH